MQKPFFKYKEKNTKNIINNLIKIIINAEKVGIKYIVLPLVDNGSIRSDKQEKLLILEIKKILKVIKNNTKILFETDYSPNKIVKLMKKFHSKKVGINYDTGNSAGLGYKFNQEKKYFKYVHNIHIKDKIYRDKSVRLGEETGIINIFLNILKLNIKTILFYKLQGLKTINI